MIKKIMPLVNTVFNVIMVGVFSFSAASAASPYTMVGQLVAAGCHKCGAVMELHYGKEWHEETQEYESYVEAYCPHCDITEEDM